MPSAFTKALIALIFSGTALFPAVLEAGPLLDWIRKRCGRDQAANQATGFLASPGSLTQAPTYLQPGQCQQTCLQTCQRVTVQYVPYTDYRTTWQRVPVTQYRPVTSTDPRSGCVVTCMRPCTDYTWQLQRIPYTTYRPVYQTQQYQMPVTTITSDGGAAGSCATCPIPGQSGGFAYPAGTFQSGGLSPGSGGGLLPADQVPMLGAQSGSRVNPYAGGVPSYRPAYPTTPPVGNPYAAPHAYSDLSSYSGYQSNRSRLSEPRFYSPPIPSGYEAPQPDVWETPTGPPAANVSPADRQPQLPNVDRPAQGVRADSWQDPIPAQRWEFNTPPAGRPLDQSAHHDVRQRWTYSGVQLASYQAADAPTPQLDGDRPWSPADQNPSRQHFNESWQADGFRDAPRKSQPANAQWN